MTENINNPFSKYKENIFGNVYLANVRNRLRDLENPSPIDCKRWVWELVQNAKDSIVGQKDRVDVDMEIIVKDDLYIFMHNGAPFNMGTLTALLYKYSEGKTNDCESTGRFGTGFLTTHSLSKTVKITGDIIEEGHDEPYGFTVTMFREGEDQELLEGLKKTENSFKVISSKPIGYTTFEYRTTTKRNREAGRLGIKNFKENIASVMLFCPQIHRIQLNDNGEILYLERDTKSILNSVMLNSCQKLSLYVKKKKENNSDEIESSRNFLYYMVDEKNEKLTKKFGKDRNLRLCCAVELDDNDNIITNSSLPCLFCSLPLVGSEAHELPFFMNSPDFEPDSERQALLLDGNDINKFGKISDPGINRMILLRSFSIYRELLEYICQSNIKKRYLLTRGLCTIPYVTRFFDPLWYGEKFITPMRNILLEYPVVWNGNEYIKYTDVFIPIMNYNTEEDKKTAFNIISQIFHGKVPSYDESINIDKNIWKDDPRIKYKNIEDCVKLVAQQENITNLIKLIHKEDEVWKWTDDFLLFLKKINSRYLSEYALIPNMNSQFVKLTNSLASSQYVPENMITCLEKLNVHWRDSHIHKKLKNFISGMDHDITYAVSKIRERVNNWSDYVFVLMHYIPYNGGNDFKKKRELLYEFCSILWNNKMYQKIDGSDFPEEIWDKVDNLVFSRIIESISSNKRLGGIYTINFINKFLDCALNYYPSFRNYPIIPNKNGTFCIFNNLYLDDNIPSIFKDCFKNCFKIDINEELIDERITSIKPLQKKDIRSYKDTLNKYFNMMETNVNVNMNNRNGFNSGFAVRRVGSVPPQPPIFTLEQKKNTAKYLIRILPKKSNQINSNINDVQNNQRELFELYKIFTGDISTTCEIERNDNNFGSIWSYSNKYIFEIIRGVIEQQGTLEALNRRIVRNNEYTLKYLRKFITFSPVGKIIPNQNDKFCEINKLYNEKDWGEKSEQIKKIAICLGYDVKELLVHEGMKNPCSKNMLLNDICNKVDELIDDKFKNPKNYQNNSYKIAAKSILEYFADIGEEKAKILFSRTYSIKEKIAYNVIYDESTRKNFAELEKTFNSRELSKMSNNSEVKTLLKKIVNDDIVCKRLNEIEQKYDKDKMEIIVNDPVVEKFIKDEKLRNNYDALEKGYNEEDISKLSTNDDMKKLTKKLVNNEKMLKEFIELSKKYDNITKPKPKPKTSKEDTKENTTNKNEKEGKISSTKERNKKKIEEMEKMFKTIQYKHTILLKNKEKMMFKTKKKIWLKTNQKVLFKAERKMLLPSEQKMKLETKRKVLLKIKRRILLKIKLNILHKNKMKQKKLFKKSMIKMKKSKKVVKGKKKSISKNNDEEKTVKKKTTQKKKNNSVEK